MRTRFAPSPTGMLHIGSLRTALYAWLLARKTSGTFLLRVEDTDRAREVPGAVEDFLRVLAWAGLAPDEGVLMGPDGAIVERGEHGPYTQSQRLAIYQQYAKQLVEQGNAYRCFCTADRLDAMRRRQQERRQAPMYDRTCANLSQEEVARRMAAGEPSVVRLRVPREETITSNDAIHGAVSFQGHTVDDQVLLKSDGFPTYHLAHVVDDRLMNIDLVIRGEEWLSSLPKHLLLWRAFGWKTPMYAHVPLILNPDRTKLSKRAGDTAASDYVRKGYLPEALINFLALLGWNPGTEQEIFSLHELIDAFSLERVQTAGAVFDLKKLEWLQGQWIRRIPLKDFAERIRPLVVQEVPAAANDVAFLEKAALIQERITFFPEAPEMLRYFYEAPHAPREVVLSSKQKVTEENIQALHALLRKVLAEIPHDGWTIAAITAALEHAATDSGCKKGQVLWTLRSILTGRAYSPGAYEIAALLGKEETLRRLATWKV